MVLRVQKVIGGTAGDCNSTKLVVRTMQGSEIASFCPGEVATAWIDRQMTLELQGSVDSEVKMEAYLFERKRQEICSVTCPPFISEQF